MMPWGVVLPVWADTQEHVDMTADVLDLIAGERPDQAHVYLHGGERIGEVRLLAMLLDATTRTVIHDAAGWPFYQMWSDGIARCRDSRSSSAAVVLNNDIDFHQGTLRALVAVMQIEGAGITYPDYDCRLADVARLPDAFRVDETHGTYRHGGMCGWCFAIRANAVHAIMDGLVCWYGDDDLAFQIEAAGLQQIRLTGVPIDHVGEATMRDRPELQAQRGQDLELFKSVWGDR